MAETQEDALKAYNLFIQTFDAKYPKAVKNLTKDKTYLIEKNYSL